MTLAPAPASAPARDHRAELPIFRESIHRNSRWLDALSGRSRARVNRCLDSSPLLAPRTTAARGRVPDQ